MEMTTREIVIDYKNAVIKGKQITILAQLNNCTTDKIRAELIRGGIPKRELYKDLGKRHLHEQAKIKTIVDKLVKEGTQNTTEGNWITPFSKFGANEKFVREHQAEIAVELESREAVSDVVLDGDGFDVNYYTDYIENKKTGGNTMNNPNTTAETRRESYEAITKETSKRGALILDVLGNKEMTVDEIVNELIARRELLHFDRNFVAPRLTELKEAGIVKTIGKRKSERTGKNVDVWAREKQD